MSVQTVNFEVTLQSVERKSLKHTGLVFRPMSSGITWHFNTPLASHFGGIFEFMVKAMKRAMKTSIGRADLDEEEFKTTVSKMACLINSRPIQAVSDFHDCDVLTTNHFLPPDLVRAVFPPNVSEDDELKTTCLEKISRRSYPTDGTKKK